jgi:NADH:ubiquinone oxidoreductase subunit K
VGIERFLILSAVLFAIGLYGALSRRNIITVLMSIEIMLSGASLVFVAFSRFITPAALRLGGDDTDALLTGQTFVIFIAVVAAAEVALGLALVIAFFRHRDTVDVSDMSLLRR